MRLKIYFSDFFEVSPESIRDYGAFNISLINDLPLFVDPFLLFNSENDQYRQLHEEIIRYVTFLRDQVVAGVLTPGLVSRWFRFPEVKENWLGYSRVGNRGSGLGPLFAAALVRNLKGVFANFGEEEVTEGSHIEKLSLIRGGVGRDNLSDFTVNLIKGYLAEYTQEFARAHINPKYLKKFPLDKAYFNYNTHSWRSATFELPNHFGEFVLLTPRDILTKDDEWINRNDLYRDFDGIVQSLPNHELRSQVSHYFQRMLPPPSQENRSISREKLHEAIARVIEQYPEILDFYIREKEENGERAHAISDERVTEIETLFIRQLTELVEKLFASSEFYSTRPGTYEETYQRVQFLKDVIENKGGWRVFYMDGKPIKREADLQVMFRLTWFATLSDVSREVNDGRGPVDYKVSRGSKDRTLVEFKLASNSKLKQNLEHQAVAYERASDATKTIKVIMYFDRLDLARVGSTLKELGLTDDPHIVLIDAQQKTSASNIK